MNKAVFLDRDSTLIEDKGHVHLIEDLYFLPGVFEGLRQLQNAKYKLIIITNQAGIGKGLYTEKDYFVFRDEMHSRLKQEEVTINAEYFCPHHLDAIISQYKQVCECRKPAVGMLLQASKEFNIDLLNSWLIGDAESDIKAGQNAGCKTILVGGKKISLVPNKQVDTFIDAVREILN